MSSEFYAELVKLEEYFNSLEPQSLIYNQIEISYINMIDIDNDNAEKIDEVVSFLSLEKLLPDDLNVSIRDTIVGPDNEPLGRLFCELQSVPLTKRGAGRKFYLSLSVRGAPFEPTRDAAFEFLRMGREIIVKKFVNVTTESAQKGWGRTQ